MATEQEKKCTFLAMVEEPDPRDFIKLDERMIFVPEMEFLKPEEITATIGKHPPATCRGCGMVLDGNAYFLGGQAYHPVTKKRCPSNYYGGFVCCRDCDYRSSLNLEESMPGHSGQKSLSIGSASWRSLRANWKDEN